MPINTQSATAPYAASRDSTSKNPKKKKKDGDTPRSTPRRDEMWEEFKRQCCTEIPALKSWPAGKTCMGNDFVTHAKLYALAGCYGISELNELSLYKLGKALQEAVLDADMVDNAVNLLQYCYDEPTPPTLKSFLVLYAACMVETLWSNTKFRELLARHGELSFALIEAMMRRLE